jgi:hypothetical protein
VVADVEARVLLTGTDARRQERVKRERGSGGAWVQPLGLASVPVAWSEPAPLPGVARTRECALRWCGGAVKRVRPGERKEKNSAAGPTRQRAGAR